MRFSYNPKLSYQKKSSKEPFSLLKVLNTEYSMEEKSSYREKLLNSSSLLKERYGQKKMKSGENIVLTKKKMQYIIASLSIAFEKNLQILPLK